jgi:hypothetical protein
VADRNQHHAVDITNAEAEVHVARISKYETMLWVQRLYAAGIRDYYHNLLPSELKNLGYHNVEGRKPRALARGGIPST